jgi:two-component system sensor histidine kinase/response regulator
MTDLQLQAQPKVLIVDDVEANLIAIEAQLQRLDCQLVRARSGNEALKQLLQHDLAVMLLDVQMPEMDGYEVARYARENPATREVPIIFLTAMHPSEENALRGYGTGAVDFLFKPLNPEVLRGKVSVFLELYRNRRKLADALAERNHMFAELEAFSYSVSHDLRAPLRPMEGFSQALLDDYKDKLDDRGRDYLTRIRVGAQRMSHLIDDLLSLSKVGRSNLDVRPVDLTQSAQDILAELRRLDPQRQVEWVCAPGMKAQGDGRLLRIALENLLRNAWKFTQKTAQPRIEMGMREERGAQIFFVKDNGAGFDPNYADKLFSPFQRLHSATEFEGTGIGLAIVQRVVRRHGGTAWAEGAPGQGATFYFKLKR